MNEFPITLTIADRQYRLIIDRSEEELVRQAGKSIEKLIREFASNYDYKDKQDLLAMVVLQNTTQMLKYEKAHNTDYQKIDTELERINQQLDDYLRSVNPVL